MAGKSTEAYKLKLVSGSLMLNRHRSLSPRYLMLTNDFRGVVSLECPMGMSLLRW